MNLEKLDLNRLYFPGLVNYGEIRKIFHRSDLHCYFSRPYVISWSLYEAAACGSPLLVNRFPGVEDIFRDLQKVVLVDLEDQVNLDLQVVRALQASVSYNPISNLQQCLELNYSLNAWHYLIFNE